MHVQEDHFPLTRSDTRMEPSSLLLPAEARRPPRPGHWPVLHTRSKRVLTSRVRYIYARGLKNHARVASRGIRTPRILTKSINPIR